MNKKEYHHGHLKEELIKIALDFIAKEGVEKLTLKILSDATDTSRSAIYKHFKNKDALIERVIEEGFVVFDIQTTPLVDKPSISIVDKLYIIGKLYLDFAKNNANLYHLLFGKKYAHIRESLLSIKDDNCSAFTRLKKMVEEGQEKGIIKRDDSYKQSIVIWASMHGLSSLVIDGFMDVEEIYEDVYENLFETLLIGMVADRV